MFFWQAIPNVLGGFGLACFVLALIQTGSTYIDRSIRLGKFLSRVANTLEKWSAWIHEVYEFTRDITTENPLYTGVGCLGVLAILFLFIGIIDTLAAGEFALFMWKLNKALNWPFKKFDQELSGLPIVFVLPLAFILLTALIWMFLVVVTRLLRIYVNLGAGVSPRIRQSILVGFWCVLGISGFWGSGLVRPYANSKVEAILNTRFLSKNLSGLDLRDKNLSGMNLFRADLSGVDLRGACLVGANLRKARISNALLSGACLDEAKLNEARLYEVDLKSASLKNAILSSASFEDVNLTDADLQGAFTKLTRIKTGTILPDGSESETYGKLDRFTNPEHPDFWDAGTITCSDSCAKPIDY